MKKGRKFDIIKDNIIKDKLSLSDPWYQLIMKMLEPIVYDIGRQRVVEVGCGLGGFTMNIAKMGGNIVGLDVSANAVHTAGELAKRLKLQDKVDLVVGDAQFLPFKQQASDIVVCSETLEHVPDYEKAFGELSRITRKSGYLCVTVPNFLSTALFENVILLLIGQPSYVKANVCVEKEHVFHIFKLKKLLGKQNVQIITMRSVDFLHVPPRVRKILKIDESLRCVSERLEALFEDYISPLRLMGANIGVLARKE
jgi:ubiquinone/menaquinone biosynthesis C-methylase UbiE